MNCSQCGYANRTAAGQCARCGAPLAGSSPTSSSWFEDDQTVSRPIVPRDGGTAQPEAVWPTFEAYPAAPEPVSAAPEPAGWAAAPGTGWGAAAGAAPEAGWQPAVQAPPPVLMGAGVQRLAAPLGTRFAAHLLDGLIVTGLVFGVYLVVLVLGLLASALSRVSYQLASLAEGVVGLLGLAAYLGVGIGYVIWGWSNGQTIGKRAMKIAVVDARSGAPIGYSRAIVRYLMMVVMGLPCYLGYFSILAADGRGWHDKAADSRVVLYADWPAPVPFWKR